MEMKPHMRGDELTIRAAMTNLCNLDGQIVAERDARIPVLDRGFLFGDSIYEVVRTYGQEPFGWAEHWQRLCLSAAAIRMRLDLDEATVARRIAATVAAAGSGDFYVRLVVSRGTGDAPNIDLAYANSPPCWVVMVRPLTPMSGKTARLAIVDRLRNDRRALDPATKSGNYLNNVLGLAEAKDAGATDCVMTNAFGFVGEASTSNLFAFVDGAWVTPRLDDGILAGITRALLLQFLPQAGERVLERNLTPGDLRRADEVFLSSTLRDIGPVTHVDGKPVGNGEAGPHTARLMGAFHEFVQTRLRTHDAPRWRQLVGNR
jgi:branched-chain amino acid aminotransferase